MLLIKRGPLLGAVPHGKRVIVRLHANMGSAGPWALPRGAGREVKCRVNGGKAPGPRSKRWLEDKGCLVVSDGFHHLV